jgi:hypothetical protein
MFPRSLGLIRLTDVTRTKISLLPAALLLLLSGCGADSPPGKPELPLSVSPGWTRKSFEHANPPPGLPDNAKPECWKAEYAGPGAAEVWTCGFAVEGAAFDAMQRTRAEAGTVKFQAGKFLVLVKWTSGSKETITALVRAVQKSLPAK